MSEHSHIDQELLNVENMDYTDKKKRIQSPLSVEAARVLGYKLEDLYFLSLKEFVNKYPENIVLDKNTQTRRYVHFDNLRKKKIHKIKEKRKLLMFNHSVVLQNIRTSDDLDHNNTSKLVSPHGVCRRANQSLSKISIPGITGMGDEHDQAALEENLGKIKDRHKKAMNNIIDHEYSIVEDRKRHNEIITNYHQKEEKWVTSKLKDSQTKEEMIKKREKETEKKAFDDLDELLKKQLEQEKMAKLKREHIYNKTATGIQQSNLVLEAKKNDEIKRKIQELENIKQAKVIQSQLEFEEQTNQIRLKKELAKSESHKNFKLRDAEDKQRLQSFTKRVYNEYFNKVKDYEIKERKMEEKRLRVEYNRVNKSTGIKEKYKTKMDLIRQFKNERFQEYLNNNEVYFNKDNERTLKVLEKERENKERKSLMLKRLDQKSSEARLRLKSLEIKEKHNIEQLWNKLENKHTKIMSQKANVSVNKMLKFESINQQRHETYDVSKRIKAADLFVNEKQLENIKDRMIKIEEFQKTKQYLADQKLKLVKDLDKKKSEVVKVVDEMINGRKLIECEKADFTKSIFEITGIDQSFVSEKSLRSPKKNFSYTKTAKTGRFNGTKTVIENTNGNMKRMKTESVIAHDMNKKADHVTKTINEEIDFEKDEEYLSLLEEKKKEEDAVGENLAKEDDPVKKSELEDKYNELKEKHTTELNEYKKKKQQEFEEGKKKSQIEQEEKIKEKEEENQENKTEKSNLTVEKEKTDN